MVSSAGSRRLSGIDAARGLALFGMMATHIFPLYNPETGDATWVALVFSGRASALFAVVAGIGLALLTGGKTPHRGATLTDDRRGIAARAVVISLIGLALGGVEGNIAIILFHYGVLFLLALPFLGLPARILAWVAGAWLLLSPVAAYLLRPWVLATVQPPSLQANPVWEHFLAPWTLLADVAVTGYYPALQWLGYVLLGLLLGRLDLAATRVQLALVLGGGAAAAGARLSSDYLLGPGGGLTELLATGQGRRLPLEQMLSVSLTGVEQTGSWWWLAVSAPHSGTPFDLVHTAGSAAAVVGLMLLIAHRYSRPLAILAAPGAMTLTLYTLHVAVMGVVTAQPEPLDPLVIFWLQAAAMCALGLVFRSIRARGPLELLASGAAQGARSTGRRPAR